MLSPDAAIVTYAVSYSTRENPPAFRTSPIWLNVFMCGITTVTIRSALEGNPATISLAYFTSLAQGLQLLDARPRKSEFVLVALSLFAWVGLLPPRSRERWRARGRRS